VCSSDLDVYERQVLRRRQSNEYFTPVPRMMLAYLKSHLSRIPDNFIPMAKRELFAYIDRIPVLNEAETQAGAGFVNTIDAQGSIAGAVSKGPDGRSTIHVGDSADFTTLVMSLFVVAADDISPNEKNLFAHWARLPTNEWTQKHREAFAFAMLHHFHDVKKTGGNLPTAVLNAIKHLPDKPLAPLPRPLNPEIRRMFDRLFGD